MWKAQHNVWHRVSESHWVVSNCLRPHGPYSPWNSPGQNIGVTSLSLLQGIFPTQGSNPGLPYCRWILYQLSHKGKPRILEWVAYPFSSGASWPRNWTEVSCTAGTCTHTEALSKWCPLPMPLEILSCSRVPTNNPAAPTVASPGRQSVPCLLLLAALCIYEASPVTGFSSSFVSLADPSFWHRLWFTSPGVASTVEYFLNVLLLKFFFLFCIGV